MPKCASQDCESSTIAKYCHSCFQKNKNIEAAKKTVASDIIADLKKEFAAAKELGEEQLYLDGLEHAILLIEEIYKN